MAPRTENIWELFGSGTFQRDSSKKDLKTGQIPFLKRGDWILGLPRFMLNLLSPTSSIATNLYNMIWTLYQSDYEYGYHKLRQTFRIFCCRKQSCWWSKQWACVEQLAQTWQLPVRVKVGTNIYKIIQSIVKLESARIWLPDKYPPLHRGGVQEKQIHRTLCYQARSIVQIFSYHFPIIFLSFSYHFHPFWSPQRVRKGRVFAAPLIRLLRCFCCSSLRPCMPCFLSSGQLWLRGWLMIHLLSITAGDPGEVVISCPMASLSSLSLHAHTHAHTHTRT